MKLDTIVFASKSLQAMNVDRLNYKARYQIIMSFFLISRDSLANEADAKKRQC